MTQFKKCPGCWSYGSDSDDTCGVCGTSLAGTLPLQHSIHEEILGAQAKEREEEQLISRRVRRRGKIWTIFGSFASIGTLALAAVLFFTGGFGNLIAAVFGLFLFPLGIWILANVILGGLGMGRWREFGPWSVGSGRGRSQGAYALKLADGLKEERRDIVSTEEMGEERDVRRERRKEEFD